MDSSENEELWRELRALRARVGELEARAAASGSARAAPAREAEQRGPGEQPDAPALSSALSFVPPAQPSLESRIGSQWFNRIGIVAVLIGAAWFLKYAVDRDWLGALARVLIGAAAGLGLIAWSERFRSRGYPVFSFSLKAVGTGFLYLSLWAAYSLFHLLDYPAAFAGMVVVTAANALLCWRQRSEVLAGIAAIGGFLTPALLEPDHASVVPLGLYLLLLNSGLLGLLAARRWPRLLPAAFVGTSCYLVGFAVGAPGLWQRGQGGAASVVLALFFALFSLAPFLLRADGVVDREDATSRAIAVAVAVLNTVLGGLELWRMAEAGQAPVADWVPLLMAGWFAVLLLLGQLPGLGRQRALLGVHSGILLSLVAVGIWTGFSGGAVIAGWALEAAVLLLLGVWRGATEGARVLASPMPAAMLLLGAATLLVGRSVAGTLPDGLEQGGRMFLNEQFGLYLLLIGVCVLLVRLAARQHGARLAEARTGGVQAEWRSVGAGAAVAATVLLLLAGVLENHSYWGGVHGVTRAGIAGAGQLMAEQFWDSAWAGLLGLGLLGLGFWLRWAFLRWQALALLTLAVAKVFLVDTRALSQGFRIASFLGLGVLLLLVSFIYQRDLLHLRGEEHGG